MKVTKLYKTCESCPAQWEGWTDDRRQLYIRYRWGWLTASVGEVGDESEFAGVCGAEIYSESLGDEFHGSMSDEEMKGHLKEVLKF